MSSRQAIWQKKKRSTDPEYREKLRLESEAYWAANKDEIKAARRERRKTDPEYREKQSYYKTRCLYGISDDDRDALLASQGGVCAICRQKSERPLGIDHCHSSGKVRGFLCFKCNAGLGMFDDDTDRMRAAIAYLERTRREPALKTEPGENARATNISPLHNQKGTCMTQDESFIDETAIPAVADAPPLAPARADAPASADFAPLDLAALLALDIPERGMVLDPIIPEKGLALLYAMRGTGKTHVALGIAHAVATGTDFLNWRAPRPRRVLVVDGEMPAADLRSRLRAIVAGAGVAAAPGMLRVLAGDLIDDGIGDLAAPDVQHRLERCLDGVELVILDNLASLIAGAHENDADAWLSIQQWLLRLRRRGVAVIVVHHAGKNGEQRGISNREDLLDTSISLRRPPDYSPAEGARFEVHVAKGRALRGARALPFEATLTAEAGRAVWTVRGIEDVEQARVEALLAEGMSIRDIAEETGIARSTVHRLKQKLAWDPSSDPAETAKAEQKQ